MVFDLIPNLLSSIITVLFPIFASYKALHTSDPAQLTPWLMYWVVLSCFSLVESWTWFILSWLPFYAFLRLILLSYLVLPQTQGARLLYQTYIHPFLSTHEAEIDHFISRGHDRAKAAGLQYLKRAIEFIKVNILGLQPKAQSSFPPREGAGNYAQSLLSRFNLPAARQGFAAASAPGDFYGLLSTAIGQMGRGESSHEDVLSRSATLIPMEIEGNEEKMTFLATQRERLSVLLTALDKEASELGNEEGIRRDVERRLGDSMGDEGLRKRGSEVEFERIEREDIVGGGKGEKSAGSWMPWGWAGKATGQAEGARGSSSAVDARL